MSPDQTALPEEPALSKNRSAEDIEELLLPDEGENKYEDDDLASSGEIWDRRIKIMEYLKRVGRLHASNIRMLVDEKVSEKTLQRDLVYLVESGFIRREGDNRWTVYVYVKDLVAS